MDLDALLLEAETGVLDEAYAALHRRHVTHYELAGETFTQQRLADPFRLVVAAIQTHDLAAMSAYSERVSEERFNHGFDISEVQMAFNSLERGDVETCGLRRTTKRPR